MYSIKKALMWSLLSSLMLVAGCEMGPTGVGFGDNNTTVYDGGRPHKPWDWKFGQCKITTQSVNFGQVVIGHRATRSISFRNVGDGRLSGDVRVCSDFTIALGDTVDLAPGEGGLVIVEFAPVQPATIECTLRISNCEVTVTAVAVE